MEHDGKPEFDITTTESCRILTVSTSRSQALALVDRVKSLSPISGTASLSADTERIPWTISNKYYSANVHFAPHAIHGLSPHRVQNVPAVIFVWAHGEAYKHHIQRLADDLDGYEPEVCLAVRVDATEPIKQDDRAEEQDLREEESVVDDFLATHGFEFVDASGQSTPRPTENSETHAEEISHGIPRLPRVVDALSTIMWPSMQSQTRPKATRGRSAEFLDWAQDSPDTSMATDTLDHSRAAADDIVARSSVGLTVQEGRMQREMEALEHWLQKDDFDFHDDPWRFNARSGGTVVASPSSEESLSAFGAATAGAAQQSSSGFDDDFTVFVSAPSEQQPSTSSAYGSFTTGADFTSGANSSFKDAPFMSADTSFNAAGDASFASTDASFTSERSQSLAPSSGPFYHSLGSVSDFGDDQAQAPHDLLPSDDEDDDLPSKTEIREASARIFGASPRPAPPALPSGSASTSALPPTQSTSFAPLTTPSAPPSGPSTGSAPPSSHADDYNADPDDYDMAPFDLSRVLSALQGMKEEIAGMANEEERRKAAAKVALGLVYGLEAEGRRDEERGGA
ncbi:hypothetical protein BD626DRAFT_536592 [Schizophyllum amplum]|uniref:Alpha and gamma adaptin binding protein p34-domain-containing protein n=1 Tax=Schizophyllum amplum TaxID=97359 RepID=A0A550CG91_9AGAR|nr:hypothetical protein BD626DRAFT_536592 [Auriculariopsis ampla]